jgi:phosphatidate phosphatase APP1
MTIINAFRKVIRLLARPVKIDSGHGGIVIHPYRGYGSQKEVFLIGRVFRQPGTGSSVREGTLRRDLLDVGRRILRWGIADAVLEVSFSGTKQQVTTDRDGYFRIHLRLAQLPPSDRLWHSMDLKLVKPSGVNVKAQGSLFVPPRNTRYVVISDIDDTVMYTGVANKIKMFWRLFFQGAQSRVAFPGVAAFYKALHHGASGTDLNPILYVSRGPWSLYEVLDAFFNIHEIPVGPILFLREWGLTLQRPLPRQAEGHKLDLIRNMLSLYSDLPFILIGDSGQHDPEIYIQVVREHPERILATYIRNVSRDPERCRAIEALALEAVNVGSSLVLAADSFAMAEHAAEHGFISPETLAEVLKEREEQQGTLELKATRTVERSTMQETREAVEHGEVKDALAEEAREDSPPNVVIEPENKKASKSMD